MLAAPDLQAPAERSDGGEGGGITNPTASCRTTKDPYNKREPVEIASLSYLAPLNPEYRTWSWNT